MEIKNIITIDFDIIMAPSIELYNYIVTEHRGLEEINDYNNLFSYCNADLTLYSYLSFYIFKLFESLDNTKIHFIRNHEQAYYYLNEDVKYNLYNIDHHHDCGYMNSVSQLYCGNWILKLKEEGKINTYTWITDHCSTEIPNNIGVKMNIYKYPVYELPIPDKLIVCESAQWIPEQFLPLFQLWINFYNIYFNKEEPLIIEELK